MNRCVACHEYTMRTLCPHCGGRVANPLPPKYGPEDPYGAYRRRLKKLNAAPGGS